MCVYDVRGEKSRGQTSYERGVAMPMFLGATSKVILAQLPDRALRSVYLANEKRHSRIAANARTAANSKASLGNIGVPELR